jgi:hypothetical protein
VRPTAVARHNDWVRTTPAAERRDTLRALEAGRRSLPLTAKLDDLARKARSRAGQARQAELRQALRGQVESQLAERSRCSFRGPVAVKLEVDVPASMAAPPGLRAVCKDHLDLLSGLVYEDDHLIEHLSVHRRVTARVQPQVRFEVLPVRLFTAAYDLAIKLADELPTAASRPDQPPRWGGSFGGVDRELLAYDEGVLATLEDMQALAEELEEDDDLYAYEFPAEMLDAFADWETRVSHIEQLRASIATARGRRLVDQRMDYFDRPGELPMLEAELNDLDRAVEVVRSADAGPGCFVLPPPPRRSGELDWPLEARRVMAGQRVADRMIEVRFGGALGLDVALGHDAGERPDLDNLAYQAVAAFEEVYAPHERGLVQSFRAYTQRGHRRVRLRVLPRERLELLDATLVEARALQLEEAASRHRA